LSTISEWAAAQVHELEAVERQRNYLRNPLPPGDGICAVCRSTAGDGFTLCYQCSQHHSAAGEQLADIVAPISYSIKGGQHAWHLIVYKADQPSAPARYNLSALGIMYLAHHWDCLTTVLGGPFTHIVTVPSTRGRQGPHPIDSAITNRIALTVLRPVANPAYTAEDRDFHEDRFYLPPNSAAGGRVLLVDDTWTTGGRIQSLAFRLKSVGALAVAVVVLGRHVNPGYGPSKPLVERLRTGQEFDLNRCVVDDAPYVGRYSG
jgi:predicted amidophosphoribosyltransferase